MLLALLLFAGSQVQAQKKLAADSIAAVEKQWVAKTLANTIAPRSGSKFKKAPAGFALYFIKADTLKVPYWVYVPKQYNPAKAHKTIVYLHGGVGSIKQFQYKDPEYATESIFALAERYNAIVLYPFARKDFGWMQQPASFQYVLEMIGAAKQTYHINAQQVFLGGMSNGGSATFWFASNHSDLFAGFYTFAALPKLQISEINFKALANKPFYSLHAHDDSLYLYKNVKATYDLHKAEAKAWHLETVPQGGHGFIYRKYGEEVMQGLLDKLLLH
jgi:poly(3-hydroxybutyrate) depolymerase